MESGCESLKCPDYKDGVCHYDSPYCKYDAADEQYAELAAENAKLREALEMAIEWDGYDDEGVEAVWLEKAEAALREAE